MPAQGDRPARRHQEVPRERGRQDGEEDRDARDPHAEGTEGGKKGGPVREETGVSGGLWTCRGWYRGIEV